MLFFPIGTDRPQRRFPWVNVLLIAANVVLFAASKTVPLTTNLPGIAGEIYRATGMMPGWEKYLLQPTSPELYQFITYQFLHENLAHIFFNMLFLYVFGNNLNEKLGHVGYLAFYIAGGVLAGVGHVLTAGAPILGASGSISAVTGLFLVLLPRTHIRMFVWIFIYVDVWEIPSMFFILFKVGQDVLEQVWGSTQVAYMAHISGTAAGVIIGLILVLAHLVQRDHYDLLAMLNRYRRRKTYESLVARGYEPFAAGGAGVAERAGPSRNEAGPVDPRVESLRGEISRLLRLHELADAATRYRELRTVDAAQVLAEQDQLDVGNQLMAESRYGDAAGAYEDYLRVYSGSAQRDQITLMLGVIYARYLGKAQRAVELLRAVLPRLHNESERQLAQGELEWIESQAASASPAAVPPFPPPSSGPSTHPA